MVTHPEHILLIRSDIGSRSAKIPVVAGYIVFTVNWRNDFAL
jgi:hypothetical protein